MSSSTISSNNMKPSNSGVPEAQLIIDLSNGFGSDNIGLYLCRRAGFRYPRHLLLFDSNFMPQIMSI
ncbi:hypothetical protein SHDE107825_01235 [Shewanella denitrificans]